MLPAIRERFTDYQQIYELADQTLGKLDPIHPIFNYGPIDVELGLQLQQKLIALTEVVREQIGSKRMPKYIDGNFLYSSDGSILGVRLFSPSEGRLINSPRKMRGGFIFPVRYVPDFRLAFDAPLVEWRDTGSIALRLLGLSIQKVK